MRKSKKDKVSHESGLMHKGNSINLFQFGLILIHTKIGVGIITLARDVQSHANSDGWISILLAGLFIQIVIFIYGSLIKRFPNQNLFEITEIILGKVLGKLVMMLYFINLLIISAIMLTKYTVILKSWLMPLTPEWVLLSFIIILAVYVAKENLQIISRFFVLASFVIVVFIGSNFYALKQATYTYLLPIGSAGLTSILKGSITSIISFQGFEYILMIAPFVVASPQQIVKAATITNIFVTLFYTFIIITIQMIFSPEDLSLITEPIFYVVKAFSFTMIERPDLLFTSMWIILVATSGIVLLFVTSTGLNTLFGTEQRTLFVYIVAIISFILSLFFYGEYRIELVTRKFFPFILFFSTGLPLLLLILSFLRKQTGVKQK